MRKPFLLGVLTLCVSATQTHAQTNPCKAKPCQVVFDWGDGSVMPDVDRKYGSPAALENAFIQTMNDAGWVVSPSTSTVLMTVRVFVQNRALCDAVPGFEPDYSCHTAQRASVLLQSNDSGFKSPGRLDVTPRCPDPKALPTFGEFGAFVASTLIYTVGNGGKGQRPSIRCR